MIVDCTQLIIQTYILKTWTTSEPWPSLGTRVLLRVLDEVILRLPNPSSLTFDQVEALETFRTLSISIILSLFLKSKRKYKMQKKNALQLQQKKIAKYKNWIGSRVYQIWTLRVDSVKKKLILFHIFFILSQVEPTIGIQNYEFTNSYMSHFTLLFRFGIRHIYFWICTCTITTSIEIEIVDPFLHLWMELFILWTNFKQFCYLFALLDFERREVQNIG